MHIQDAGILLIRFIRERPKTMYSNYGYDVYLLNVIRWHLEQTGLRDSFEVDRQVQELSPEAPRWDWTDGSKFEVGLLRAL
jgi:hypothetical protein